jgi:Asp/Glu/hydantoin racemase
MLPSKVSLGTSGRFNILIINPNSTRSMTDALSDLIGLSSYTTNYHYFTNPTGPPSIDNAADGELSVRNCIPPLSEPGFLKQYNGFLVACYSWHPLVAWLQKQQDNPVTGIFEASIWKSLKIIGPRHKFGIVSTGKVWEDLLSDATKKYFKQERLSLHDMKSLFVGVETTGLNATDLHDAPEEEVRTRMIKATKRLARDEALRAVCLGCAGMSGMDVIVREALIEELGSEGGDAIEIVDGVKAGVEWLEEILNR